MEEKVIGVVGSFYYYHKGNDKEVLPGDNLGDTLGLDSLDLIELAMAIEDEFDLSVSDEEFGRWETVQDVIDFVAKD